MSRELHRRHLGYSRDDHVPASTPSQVMKKAPNSGKTACGCPGLPKLADRLSGPMENQSRHHRHPIGLNRPRNFATLNQFNQLSLKRDQLRSAVLGVLCPKSDAITVEIFPPKGSNFSLTHPCKPCEQSEVSQLTRKIGHDAPNLNLREKATPNVVALVQPADPWGREVP